jgi:hypothetical protein
MQITGNKTKKKGGRGSVIVYISLAGMLDNSNCFNLTFVTYETERSNLLSG